MCALLWKFNICYDPPVALLFLRESLADSSANCAGDDDQDHDDDSPYLRFADIAPLLSVIRAFLCRLLVSVWRFYFFYHVLVVVLLVESNELLVISQAKLFCLKTFSPAVSI